LQECYSFDTQCSNSDEDIGESYMRNSYHLALKSLKQDNTLW
jgi:hypothetical protein